MGELAKDVFEELRAVCQGRKIELVVNNPPQGSGDPSMVRQVVVNLLSNAMKFTRKRDEAVIEIGGTVRNSQSHVPISGVKLTVVELGIQAQSDEAGRFRFSGLVAGSYSVRAVKQGFSTVTRSVQVPGISPTSFDIDLSLSA